MAKIVQKQRSRSSADVHGRSWVAPRLHQLSPKVCCAPRDKSPCTDLLDPMAMWDHLCSSSVPRYTRGDLLLPSPGRRRAQGSQRQDHPTRGAGRCSASLEIKPRAECWNYINQLIIPLLALPVHSLVSELGFSAFLQSSWRWDVEHGVLLLLMVLKKNISSAGWHVLIICEGKMSARFGMGKTFSSRLD